MAIYPLTSREKSIVWRRRAGISQEDYAMSVGVHRTTFARHEKEGRVTTPDLDLTNSEKCFILRIRSGKTQREIAEELGLSRPWVNEMENRVASPLLCEFWGIE